jgi:hypothetical protein
MYSLLLKKWFSNNSKSLRKDFDKRVRGSTSDVIACKIYRESLLFLIDSKNESFQIELFNVKDFQHSKNS